MRRESFGFISYGFHLTALAVAYMYMLFLIMLTSVKDILTRKLAKGSHANIANPDQTPDDVASDQGLHWLLRGFSIKHSIKIEIV